MSRSCIARRGARSGVAAVEMAVCLPAIVLLVFASIECCSMIFVTQALNASTYEAARVAIQKSSTTAEVIQRAEEILAGHGVSGTTVTCEPADVAGVAAGQPITVVVTASCDANRIAPPFFFGGRNVEARTTMAKEG